MDNSASASALLITAISLGFLHTLIGPDHYIPFVAVARVRRWSLARTLAVTTLCGLGHVASSAVLGLIGVSAGLALFRLEAVEALRGRIAGWSLLAFGIVYFVWGLCKSVRSQPHSHVHSHADGTVHSHEHTHHSCHLHVHESAQRRDQPLERSESISPWVLFTLFLFGPCEPLIPLLMYPAVKENYDQILLVTLAFGTATITAMLFAVTLLSIGVAALAESHLNRHTQSIAGLSIVACGGAVLYFGM